MLPLRPVPARAYAWAPLVATTSLVVVGAACGGGGDARPAASAPPRPPTATAGSLRGPDAFAHVADRDARARALFVEATRVMLHPRCVACHPVGDSPLQGDTLARHEPPVVRGPHDDGVPALTCGSCHQDRNLPLARVPGAPTWHLAPRSMTWQGRSPKALCEQIKDPARNGGKTLAAIAEHAAHDPLVAWGWDPGHGRTPAPGSQATFGALVHAWVQAGAACPGEGESP